MISVLPDRAASAAAAVVSASVLDSAAAVVAAAVVAGALDELLPQAVSPRTNAAASTGVISFFHNVFPPFLTFLKSKRFQFL